MLEESIENDPMQVSQQEREEVRDALRTIYEELNDMGNLLLHLAARSRTSSIISYLLDHNYDINLKDRFGRTPLITAIIAGNFTGMEVLLERGADITIVDKQGKSALYHLIANGNVETKYYNIFLTYFYTTCNGHIDAANQLMKAGYNLYQAAAIKSTKVIKYMIDQGCPVNHTGIGTPESALHVSVLLDDVETVKLLVSHGADIEYRNVYQQTPLSYVCGFQSNPSTEKLEILRILLDHGVIMTTCYVDGSFQVRPVLEHGPLEAIRMVLEANIDITAKDGDDSTVLHYLATNITSGIAKLLEPYIEQMDFNAIDMTGMSPLHNASMYGNAEMVKFLLENGADPNCVHVQSGCTPLLMVCEQPKPEYEEEYNETTDLLLQYNANPQYIATKEDGTTMIIFDCPLNSHKKNSILASIAIIEAQGIELNSTIREIINRTEYSSDFKRYSSILKSTICGTVTTLKLLSSSERRIVTYLGNTQLALKLKRLSYSSSLKRRYPYFYKALKKSCTKAAQLKTLKYNAAKIVQSIFANRVNNDDLVVEKTVSYLSDQNLVELIGFNI